MVCCVGMRAAVAAAAAALLACAAARPTYVNLIPNGDAASRRGSGITCAHLGHAGCVAGAARNQFGEDFEFVGRFAWTAELCSRDSDGDGVSNGQELGDPCCLWTQENTNPPGFRTTGLSHPGNASEDAAKNAPGCPTTTPPTTTPETTQPATKMPMVDPPAAENPIIETLSPVTVSPPPAAMESPGPATEGSPSMPSTASVESAPPATEEFPSTPPPTEKAPGSSSLDAMQAEYLPTMPPKTEPLTVSETQTLVETTTVTVSPTGIVSPIATEAEAAGPATPLTGPPTGVGTDAAATDVTSPQISDSPGMMPTDAPEEGQDSGSKEALDADVEDPDGATDSSEVLPTDEPDEGSDASPGAAPDGDVEDSNDAPIGIDTGPSPDKGDETMPASETDGAMPTPEMGMDDHDGDDMNGTDSVPSPRGPETNGDRNVTDPVQPLPTPGSIPTMPEATSDCGAEAGCAFTFCDESGPVARPIFYISGQPDVAFTPAICERAQTNTVGVVSRVGEARVDTATGLIPISMYRPRALSPHLSSTFFKTYNVGVGYSGVGHETVQGNQVLYVNKRCFVLPIEHYVVIDPTTGNAIDNKYVSGDEYCVGFTTVVSG